MARGFGRTLATAGVLGALFAPALIASPAQAEVYFYNGPGFVQPAENVLYNDPSLQSTGFHVQGHTNQTDTVVNLDGNTQLYANGGQARIDTLETKDPRFTELRISFDDPNLSFTELEFNVNALSDGNITVTAFGDGLSGASGSFAAFSNDDLNRAGQNFYSLKATNGSKLTAVLIQTDITIQDVRQVRIGGITSNSSTPVGSTGDLAPEGDAGAMLACGLFPLGLIFVRRGRRSRFLRV
jgi:hypothetical protein